MLTCSSFRMSMDVRKLHKHRQISGGLPVMWNPAVPGMEDAHICAVLSFRRIRRYPVLPFKTAEKHVTLVMWGSHPYIYCILANLKGRFFCRSRWHLPLMTDFSVVRQLIGTRSPISKLVFLLPANCPAPEVRKEFRILCVSPHDRHIAHLPTIAYTEYLNYATSL